MTDIERERRALAVFADVCEASIADRAAILDDRCAGDAALRARVDELLDADASKGLSDAAADDFLQAAVEEVGGPTSASTALPVDQFGDYKVIRVIGEGGMGTVYEAEQAHPKRRVAIKAVRADLRTPRARRRFEYEAQVLAGLEHPGIARLYEANVRPDVRTRGYLVMEYVDGLPLDQYVKAKSLELDEKLHLFLRICEPIAHAHRMGVIHRDLKPANILVMADGQPKVLDFGVARTLEVHGSAATLTAEGQIVGTLAYMSPEQFDGRVPVDTRTDVYALGVVLHQLLTGKDPIDVGGAGLASAAHKLLTVVPAPIGQHDRRLRGDLEVIVARALEKEPARRYASVEQLGKEIRRHLNGEPIEARADSAAYILRRAAWRHRHWVAGFAAILAAVSAFAIYAEMQSKRNNLLAIAAAKARDDAGAARVIAEQRAEDLRHSLYISNIAFARVSLDQREVVPLRRALDACDADLRDWEWFHLDRLSDRADQTMQPPGERNNTSVEIDSAFRFVAFGLPNGAFRMVSPADGHEYFRGKLGGDKVKVAIASDANFMVAMTTTEITARRLPDGQQLWRTKKPGSNASDRLNSNTVRISPDGTMIAASDYFGLSLLKASDGSSIRRIDAEKLMTFEWMPDSSALILGDYAGHIRRITLEGNTITEYPGYGPVVQRLGISANGALLAAGNYLGRAMIWDTASGGLHAPRLETGGNAVRRFCFSADASTVYIAGDDRLVRTIDVKSGALRDAYVGHDDGVLLATLSSDGTRLLSISRDNAIKTWPVPLPYPGVEVTGGPQQVAGVLFTPDSQTIYAAGYDGRIRSWARNGSLKPKAEFGEGTGHVVSLSANRNMTRIVTGTDDGNVRVWDCATHHAVCRISCAARVSAAEFSPDDQKVLTGSSIGKVQIWNAETGAPAGAFAAHASGVQSISFHPDGHSFATGGADGLIRLWSWPELKQIAETRGDPKSVTDVVFSHDGRWLGSCGELSSPALRDARSLNVAYRLIGGGGIRSISFSPNSRRVVTSGHDGTARIWDVERGRELLTLRCGNAFVHRAVFSPDARTLATGDASGSIRIWAGPAESGAVTKIPATQPAAAPATMPQDED